MPKFPIPVNVTHNVELPDLKEAIDHGAASFKQILRTVGITLAIGIPAAILFGVAANVAGDYVSAQLTTPELQ